MFLWMLFTVELADNLSMIYVHVWPDMRRARSVQGLLILIRTSWDKKDSLLQSNSSYDLVLYWTNLNLFLNGGMISRDLILLKIHQEHVLLKHVRSTVSSRTKNIINLYYNKNFWDLFSMLFFTNILEFTNLILHAHFEWHILRIFQLMVGKDKCSVCISCCVFDIGGENHFLECQRRNIYKVNVQE